MCRGAAKRQTKALQAPQGRADLRAPKRSACRRQEAPKTAASPETTTRPLGRSSTTKGSNRLPKAGGPKNSPSAHKKSQQNIILLAKWGLN